MYTTGQIRMVFLRQDFLSNATNEEVRIVERFDHGSTRFIAADFPEVVRKYGRHSDSAFPGEHVSSELAIAGLEQMQRCLYAWKEHHAG